MARDPKTVEARYHTVAHKIAREINTHSRYLIWIMFTKDLSESPSGYFHASDRRTLSSGEVPEPMRIDLPVPGGVKMDDIHMLVSAIIRDGYNFERIVNHPGRDGA